MQLRTVTTMPAHLRTVVKFLASSTGNCMFILQYFLVQHSTTTVLFWITPVPLCTRNYDSSTGLRWKVRQQLLHPNYKEQVGYHCETSFTMRCGTAEVSLQLHQILCLPRKLNAINDPKHVGHIISNGRSNKSHPPTRVPCKMNVIYVLHHTRNVIWQCVELSSSNLTKNYACHRILEGKVCAENPWSASAQKKRRFNLYQKKPR